MAMKNLPNVNEFVVSEDGGIDLESPVNAEIVKRTLETIAFNEKEMEKDIKALSMRGSCDE